MNIIGLNSDMYISSACLSQNGLVVAAGAEERFTREKQTRNFPAKAVEYCLRHAGIASESVDHWAMSWNPSVYFTKFNPLLSGKRRHMVEVSYSVPDHIMGFYGTENRPQADHMVQSINIGDRNVSVHYVTHHRAHAANAYYLSPFESAAILTADSQGEFESTTLCRGRGNKIEVLETENYPHSLGVFYSTITEYLGFRPNSDEWKVMALASFATAPGKYDQLFQEHLVRFLDDGRFELNLSYFKGHLHEQPNLFTSNLVELLGPARRYDDDYEERHFAIAGAMQRTAEKITYRLLERLHRISGEENLAVAGGFFMNSVLNGKLLENTPFKKVFISSCPDDSGNSFGAALYLHNHILGLPRAEGMTHNYLGPSYSNEDVKAALEQSHLSGRLTESATKEAAVCLAKGEIIGWFRGRMEFGQRALGNRSILADPGRADMKDKINKAVKFREAFRPFAPAVLEDRQHEYFKLPEGDTVPFMEKVYPGTPLAAEQAPAIYHVDGSCRLQTVQRATNPDFYSLIKEFDSLTGLPIVLNTSFNRNGEPVVCSPEDALRTFFSCGLDALFLEDYIIRKDDLK